MGCEAQDKHCNLKVEQFEKNVDENGKVYLQFSGYASKTNRGGLRHMTTVDDKVVRQYENTDDPQQVLHCQHLHVCTIPLLIPKRGMFHYRPLPNQGEIIHFSQQPIVVNTLGKIIPKMCMAAGITGWKMDHSGEVTCTTTLL